MGNFLISFLKIGKIVSVGILRSTLVVYITHKKSECRITCITFTKAVLGLETNLQMLEM